VAAAGAADTPALARPAGRSTATTAAALTLLPPAARRHPPLAARGVADRLVMAAAAAKSPCAFSQKSRRATSQQIQQRCTQSMWMAAKTID